MTQIKKLILIKQTITMKKFLLIIFFIANATLHLFAQQPTREWVKTYNSPSNTNDAGYRIQCDKNENIYVVGVTNGSKDIFILKYNSSGQLLWNKIYLPGSSKEYPSDMIVDDSSNVIVIGYQNNEVLALKINSAGDYVWTKTYKRNSTPGDVGCALALDSLRNIYIAATSYLSPTGQNIWLLKINPYSGDTLWTRVVQRAGNCGFYKIFSRYIGVDKDNNIYITGTCDWNCGAPFDDYFTIKYKPNGDSVRSVLFVGNNFDTPNGLCIDNDNNIIITGNSVGYTYNNNILTVKYDSSLNLIWYKRFNELIRSESNEIVLDNQNNIYICGQYGSTNPPLSDYIIIKYYPNGDTSWVRTYNGAGNGNDYALNMEIDLQNNLYVIGTTTEINQNQILTTIKLNPNGLLYWQTKDSGGIPYNEKPITVYNSNIYLTGWHNQDNFTIKYSQPTGIINNNNKSFISHIITYPNPFNGELRLEIILNNKSIVSIKIYNILGQLIEIIINEKEIKAGKNKFMWFPNNLPSGVYFIKISKNEAYEIKKVLLIK